MPVITGGRNIEGRGMVERRSRREGGMIPDIFWVHVVLASTHHPIRAAAVAD